MVRDRLVQPLFALGELLLQQANVLLPFAQDVGGARDVKKRLDLRKSLVRADAEEEVRVRRFVRSRIQANFDVGPCGYGRETQTPPRGSGRESRRAGRTRASAASNSSNSNS